LLASALEERGVGFSGMVGGVAGAWREGAEGILGFLGMGGDVTDAREEGGPR